MSAGNPTKKMKMWGVGRIFARISLAYGLLIWATEHFFSLNFKIAIIPPYLRAAPGVLLIVTGLIFFAAAVTAVRRALSAGRLVTTGVFRCCRHPLYAAWPVVKSDMNQRGSGRFGGEGPQQPEGEGFAVMEQTAESDLLGDGPIVEKDNYLPPGGEPAEIRILGVDPLPAHVGPVSLPPRTDPGPGGGPEW